MKTMVTSNYNSSTVKSATYSYETRLLKVEFSQATYKYYNVDPADFEAFDKAQSQGQALNEYIKPKYQYERLSEDVSDNIRTDLNDAKDVSDVGVNKNINQLNS